MLKTHLLLVLIVPFFGVCFFLSWLVHFVRKWNVWSCSFISDLISFLCCVRNVFSLVFNGRLWDRVLKPNIQRDAFYCSSGTFGPLTHVPPGLPPLPSHLTVYWSCKRRAADIYEYYKRLPFKKVSNVYILSTFSSIFSAVIGNMGSAEH